MWCGGGCGVGGFYRSVLCCVIYLYVRLMICDSLVYVRSIFLTSFLKPKGFYSQASVTKSRCTERACKR